MEDEKIKSIIQKLAEIEHEQWMEWSKNIARTEKISPERVARWQTMWRPYNELSPQDQFLDEVWASKVFRLLKKLDVIK